MTIEHRAEGELGSFFAVENDEEAGELAYRLKSGLLTLDHTDVEPAFKGKDVGKQLVQAAVEYARQENLKIQALCTFAELMFKRNPDWSDVLTG